MPSSTNKPNSNKLTTWELLFIFLGFISIVTLIISVYVSYTRDAFYPPWGPVAYGGHWGGPWNIPTRYPIRGWGWDIRGYPAAYPIDYGYYGNPGGQPAYPAPEPDGANSGTNLGSSSNTNNSKSDNAAPFGIEMTTKTTKSAKPKNTKPSTAPTKSAQQLELEADAEFYAKESKWWPDWVSWPWMPYFNYGLHYDVNGKLKPSNNDSIPANHAWSWW
jgi:hypothetical protein